MKRARFTEEQIIGVLKEQEAGAKAADLADRVPRSGVGSGGSETDRTRAHQ